MSRSFESLSGLTNKLTNPNTLPKLMVQSAHKIEGGHGDSYRVVFSHGPKDYNEEQYDKAVKQCFDNRFSMIPLTAQLVSKENPNKPLVSMIIAGNSVSVPYDEEHTQNMYSIRANVMMDQDENIWKVSGEGENKRLVQTTEDDLDAILASRKARNVVTASYSTSLEFQNGDYVWFYDPNKYKVCSGFGLNTAKGPIGLDRHTGDVVKLDPHGIIEAAPYEQLDKEHRPEFTMFEVNSSLSGDMANRHLEYMRNLYQGTDYFAKLDSLIRQRRQIGDDGNSETTYEGVMY